MGSSNSKTEDENENFDMVQFERRHFDWKNDCDSTRKKIKVNRKDLTL